MKNILYLILLMLLSSTLSKAQVVANKCILTPLNGTVTENANLEFKDGPITIEIWSALSPFWSYRIFNTSDQDISIKWDKCYFTVNGEASKAVVGNEKVIVNDLGVPAQQLPANSKINKDLMPDKYYKISKAVNSKKFVANYLERTGKPTEQTFALVYDVSGSEKKMLINVKIEPKN